MPYTQSAVVLISCSERSCFEKTPAGVCRCVKLDYMGLIVESKSMRLVIVTCFCHRSCCLRHVSSQASSSAALYDQHSFQQSGHVSFLILMVHKVV